MVSNLELALRNVLRHGRRSAMAVGAIAFGTAAMVLAAGFIEWIFVNFREYSIHSHLGHVQVTRQGFRDHGLSDPYAYLLPSQSPALARIRAHPEVVTIAPRLNLSGLVSREGATLSFIGEAVDPAAEARLSEAMTITSGVGLAADDPQGAILGEGLAANLGAKPGDLVTLLVNTPSGGVNAVEVKVRGTFATVTKAYDDNALRVPLGTGERLMRASGAHAWVLLLERTEQTDAVAAALRSELAGQGFDIRTWSQLADFYNKTTELFSRQLGVVRWIVALIIVLSISNTMIMTVLERTWEIGTSMAIGVRRRQILLLFLVEGALLGMLGGVVGLVAGAALAVGISAYGIPMPPPPGMAHGFTGGILFTFPLAAGAFVLAVVTTLVASIYPASKAARMPIVDALRSGR